MTYKDEICRAMTWLGQQPDTLFVGQAVRFAGTSMSGTLSGVPDARKIEFPVAEEFQLGASLGLSLEGHCVVSIFPRWQFLLLALNQLVNHLDKYPLISDYRPRVIVRVGIGSEHPLDPQWQHKGDLTEAVRLMLRTIPVVRLILPEEVLPAYQAAYRSPHSTVLVEVSDYYDEAFRLKDQRP